MEVHAIFLNGEFQGVYRTLGVAEAMATDGSKIQSFLVEDLILATKRLNKLTRRLLECQCSGDTVVPIQQALMSLL